MKILVVLPFYGGSLPVGRYCVDALRSIGHVVEVFEAPSFYPAFTSLKDLRIAVDKLEHLENGFLNLVGQAVLAKTETFEPDLVLALAQAPLSRQTLQMLKKNKITTAMWFVEDHRIFTYWQGFAQHYDFFAVIQKGALHEKLTKLGTSPLYLPLAASPDFHKPIELSSAEQHTYGSDLSFMGAGYPNRRLAFKQLTDFDFKIWGSDWEGETALRQFIQREGERISPEECVKIFNASKINLNLHSSICRDAPVSDGDFVNPRTFEVACCGAFQLLDSRELLNELFSDEEMVTFQNMAQLRQLISHFISRPQARRAFAQKARARVLREHTYEQRMKTLIGHIKAHKPDWPASRPAKMDWADKLSPEMAVQLNDLLDNLGLQPTVAFEELVWAIRQQSGVLSPLETSILFLHEWKKQYSGKAK